MKKDVALYVNKYLTCARVKPKHKNNNFGIRTRKRENLQCMILRHGSTQKLMEANFENLEEAESRGEEEYKSHWQKTEGQQTM
ncbi:hypothetical protein OSB04_011794 [Centaurea solstitialis]|uniref:Uncharacterized protein n=1 Tax=Centaurea solstitialis TaxID=347529 RepID=A0AA38WLU5_9ASTR|nr:hypothetical protein OSB04_011794 [Centaurea solstitialis]